jgi:hypothetical protein
MTAQEIANQLLAEHQAAREERRREARPFRRVRNA